MGCKKSISAASTEALSADWRLGRKLGEGSFSQVYAVSHRKSSRFAALKIPKESDDNLHDAFMANKESKIWKAAGRHPNIVELIDDFAIDGRHVILMERCDHTLTQRMSGMQVGFEPVVMRMIHQLTSAIAHIHSLNIVHRDIKPDNFLCRDDDQILKLCDFGFATLMPTSGKLYGKCGTPLYMSPEMVGKGPHTLKTDVWSLGVICYLMLYGEHPYPSRVRTGESVMRAVAKGTQPRYRGRCFISAEAKEFTTTLLHRFPDARASAAQALDSAFLDLTSEEALANIPQLRKSSGALMDILSDSQSTCEPCLHEVLDGNASQTSKSSKSTSLAPTPPPHRLISL